MTLPVTMKSHTPPVARSFKAQTTAARSLTDRRCSSRLKHTLLASGTHQVNPGKESARINSFGLQQFGARL